MTTTKKPLSAIKKIRKPSVKTRENFSADVVRQIAFEAHLFCACPTCCRFTSYATTSGKARAIAEAAHINAASVSGPRASAAHGTSYLKSAANGIWLCGTCHMKIDQDPLAYPEDLLKEWKTKHAIFVRQLNGKDFDLVHFEQYSRSHNVAQRVSFLAFIEGKRVLSDALDAEYPDQVLDSLTEIRSRIGSTRGHLKSEDAASQILAEMRKKIQNFQTENPDLRNLKCNGSDPAFVKFSIALQLLRKDLLPCVVQMARDVDYTLSQEIMEEYARLAN
jgi:hypothetical protein